MCMTVYNSIIKKVFFMNSYESIVSTNADLKNILESISINIESNQVCKCSELFKNIKIESLEEYKEIKSQLKNYIQTSFKLVALISLIYIKRISGRSSYTNSPQKIISLYKQAIEEAQKKASLLAQNIIQDYCMYVYFNSDCLNELENALQYQMDSLDSFPFKNFSDYHQPEMSYKLRYNLYLGLIVKLCSGEISPLVDSYQDFKLQEKALKCLKEQFFEENSKYILALYHYSCLKERFDCIDLCDKVEAYATLKKLINFNSESTISWQAKIKIFILEETSNIPQDKFSLMFPNRDVFIKSILENEGIDNREKVKLISYLENEESKNFKFEKAKNYLEMMLPLLPPSSHLLPIIYLKLGDIYLFAGDTRDNNKAILYYKNALENPWLKENVKVRIESALKLSNTTAQLPLPVNVGADPIRVICTRFLFLFLHFDSQQATCLFTENGVLNRNLDQSFSCNQKSYAKILIEDLSLLRHAIKGSPQAKSLEKLLENEGVYNLSKSYDQQKDFLSKEGLNLLFIIDSVHPDKRVEFYSAYSLFLLVQFAKLRQSIFEDYNQKLKGIDKNVFSTFAKSSGKSFQTKIVFPHKEIYKRIFEGNSPERILAFIEIFNYNVSKYLESLFFSKKEFNVKVHFEDAKQMSVEVKCSPEKAIYAVFEGLKNLIQLIEVKCNDLELKNIILNATKTWDFLLDTLVPWLQQCEKINREDHEIFLKNLYVIKTIEKAHSKQFCFYNESFFNVFRDLFSKFELIPDASKVQVLLEYARYFKAADHHNFNSSKFLSPIALISIDFFLKAFSSCESTTHRISILQEACSFLSDDLSIVRKILDEMYDDWEQHETGLGLGIERKLHLYFLNIQLKRFEGKEALANKLIEMFKEDWKYASKPISGSKVGMYVSKRGLTFLAGHTKTLAKEAAAYVKNHSDANDYNTSNLGEIDNEIFDRFLKAIYKPSKSISNKQGLFGWDLELQKEALSHLGINTPAKPYLLKQFNPSPAIYKTLESTKKKFKPVEVTDSQSSTTTSLSNDSFSENPLTVSETALAKERAKEKLLNEERKLKLKENRPKSEAISSEKDKEVEVQETPEVLQPVIFVSSNIWNIFNKLWTPNSTQQELQEFDETYRNDVKISKDEVAKLITALGGTYNAKGGKGSHAKAQLPSLDSMDQIVLNDQTMTFAYFGEEHQQQEVSQPKAGKNRSPASRTVTLTKSPYLLPYQIMQLRMKLQALGYNPKTVAPLNKKDAK